jgi:hypothetical protein
MELGYDCDEVCIGSVVAPILLDPAIEPDDFDGPFSRNVEVMEDKLPPKEGGTTMVDVRPPQLPGWIE